MIEKSKAFVLSHWKEILSFLGLFLLGLAFSSPTFGPVLVAFEGIFALLLYWKDAVSGRDVLRHLYWLLPVLLLAFLPVIFQVKIAGFLTVFLWIFNIIGVLGAVLVGLMAAREEEKTRERMIASGALAIALLVLISFIATLSLYGPLHAALYKDEVYYWEGMAFHVADEASLLTTSGILTVSSLEYSFLPFLLAASGIALLFLDPRGKRLLLGILLSCSFLGFLVLAFLPNALALIILLAFYLAGIALRFIPWAARTPRWLGVLMLVVLSLALAFSLLILFLAFTGTDIYGSGFLRKLFDNQRFMEPVNRSIQAVSSSGVLGLLFGLDPFTSSGGLTFSTWNGGYTYWNEVPLTNLQASSFQEGGILAFLSSAWLFLVAIGVCYWAARDVRSGKSPWDRALLSVFAIAWILYASLQMDAFPFVREPTTYLSPTFGNGDKAYLLFQLAARGLDGLFALFALALGYGAPPFDRGLLGFEKERGALS